jgi:RNA polymerase sigma-70 factor (ECF subfamily)
VVPSDETLLRQVHQGDADAMATLVQRYHARLLGFTFRYTQDRQASEDLVQETFLRIIRARDSVPDVFAPWIYRIALNLCRDHAKSARLRYEQPCPEIIDDAASDPLALVEHHDLRDAVESLPPPQREVMLLHYFADWTLGEVAAALKLPLGTVKSRLFAALTQLRRVYGEADPRREERPSREAGLKGGQTVEQRRA